MSDNTYHIIKDPVHGSMQFTDEENAWIKPFIDSPNFQRLRHIKQLGLGDWIFPGAVHTRFNHSLGCCYIAGQIANKLKLSSEERQTVFIAGLLHDIGHGPFSHAFENVFKGQSVKHEDWTPFFLNDYLLPTFLETFNQNNPGLPLDETRFSIVRELIMHDKTQNQLLADIVSSQLDADRLDYLLRDSHFCGVSYGQYDLRWLLHCLAIVPYQGEDRLGVTGKGVGVVEHYLMARRLMLRNVYLHAKKYAGEFLLSMFLRYLAKHADDKQLLGVFHEHHLTQFLRAVNQFNETVNDKNIITIKQEFLIQNYGLYKRLCDYDVSMMVRYMASLDSNHPVTQLAKRLHHRILPKAITLDHSKLQQAKNLITNMKNQVQPWQLRLLELPHQAYQMDKDPILVINAQGEISNIQDDSLMISGLSNKKESLFILCVDHELLSSPALRAFLT